MGWKADFPESTVRRWIKGDHDTRIWFMGERGPLSGCDPDPSLAEEEEWTARLKLETELKEGIILTMPKSRIERYNNVKESELALLEDEFK